MSILATDNDDGQRPRALRPAAATIVPLTADASAPPVDWAHVVETHEPTLRRLIARRMANQELVDDALQETYLRAVRNCRVGRATPDARWLRTVARRASTDVYRGEPPPADDLDAMAVAADVVLPGSDEHLDSVEWRQALRWALARLSPRHRRLLALRGVHELSYREIGAVENLSEEAVTAALSRARVRLRAHLCAYEDRRAVPAIGLWLGDMLRRLRYRLQELGPRAAEWAGATLAVGVVAAMTVPVHAPANVDPAIAAGVGWTETSFVQEVAASAPEATTTTASVPPVARAGSTGDTASAAPPVERPLLAGRPDVRLTPEDSHVTYHLEVGGPNPASAEATVPVECTRSRTARQACAVLRQVPGAS